MDIPSETTILIQVQINSYHQTDFSRHWWPSKGQEGAEEGGQERLEGKDTLLVLFHPLAFLPLCLTLHEPRFRKFITVKFPAWENSKNLHKNFPSVKSEIINMCKQLLFLNPVWKSFYWRLFAFLKMSSDWERRQSTHRAEENLLNLLFDTIEFLNNNLNDFLLACSIPSKRSVSFIAIDAESSKPVISEANINFSFARCNKIEFKSMLSHPDSLLVSLSLMWFQ